MLDYYVGIIDQLNEELLPWTDEGDYFVMSEDFMRFKFRTDNELVHNKRINIPVCAILLSSVIKKEMFIILSLNYKNVFIKVIKISN